MKQDQTQWVVEFAIRKGKLDAFKKLAEEFVARVEQNEPGAKSYQWYFNDDETKCIVSELYESSEAILAHIGGSAVSTLFPKLLETAQLTRFEVYGDPNEEAKNVLAKFGAQNYHPFIGFTR
jgi:quinol monooxygenase YgiN